MWRRPIPHELIGQISDRPLKPTNGAACGQHRRPRGCHRAAPAHGQWSHNWSGYGVGRPERAQQPGRKPESLDNRESPGVLEDVEEQGARRVTRFAATASNQPKP